MAILTRISIGCGTGILAAGILLLSAESFFPNLTVVPGTMERRIPPALALIGGGLIGGVTAISTFLLSKDCGDDSPLARGWRNSGQVSRGQIVMDPLSSASIYIDSREEEEEETEKEMGGCEDESLDLEDDQEVGIRSIEWVSGQGAETSTISFPVDHPQPYTQQEIKPSKPPLVDHPQPQKTVSSTFSDLW